MSQTRLDILWRPTRDAKQIRNKYIYTQTEFIFSQTTPIWEMITTRSQCTLSLYQSTLTGAQQVSFEFKMGVFGMLHMSRILFRCQFLDQSTLTGTLIATKQVQVSISVLLYFNTYVMKNAIEKNSTQNLSYNHTVRHVFSMWILRIRLRCLVGLFR